jgi:hypothetical protein
VSARGVPLREDRCGKWMRLSRDFCALPAGHVARCRTETAMRRAYERNIARHARVMAERRHWVDEYKMRKGCTDCGWAEHPVGLDLDHRDPEMKTADVSSLLSGKLDILMAEVEKCDVRCACCHRIRTYSLHHSVPRRRPVLGETENGPAA